MTAVAYKGPIPPKNCIQERYAQYDERDGLLYKIRGGDAVFWGADGKALYINRWSTDEKLRLIR